MIKRIWDKENKYKEGILKEYRYWVLEVNYRQHTLGSYIIFAKREVGKISELTDEELLELKQVMREIENALAKIEFFKPDRFSYLQLDYELPYLHFQGIPRYQKPRIFIAKIWADTGWGGPPVLANRNVGSWLVAKIRDLIKSHL